MDTDQRVFSPTQNKLTAREFIDIITLVNEYYYNVFYAKYDYHEKAIIFKDIEVVEDIYLHEKISVSLPIIFINSKFQEIYIYKVFFYSEVRILSGTFHKRFWIEGAVFAKDFRIENGKFEDFIIGSGVFEKELLIKGGSFSGEFRIEAADFKEVVSIHGGKFHKGFSIFGGNFEKFWITDGDFKAGFGISGGTFRQFFYLKGGEFSVFYIGRATFKDIFMIEGEAVIRNFNINNTVFEDKINFYSGNIFKLEVSSLLVKIFMKIYERLQIEIIEYTDILPKDSMVIIKCKLSQLVFNDFQNFGIIVLKEVSLKEKISSPHFSWLKSLKPNLILTNSDLGKATFINCDLSEFNLIFESSKITDLFVTGTQMPNRIMSRDTAGKADFRQHQLGYSQIKKIYEARGDRVESNRYYAREMEAYQQTLSWRKWEDFWEKLNLSLNKYSTNYGQSWQRGLATTLGVSAVFYILYCWSLGYWPAFPTSDNFSLFSHTSSYFLEFLNPIHKADYVADELLKAEQVQGKIVSININGWARTIEGISRIFIAYFVYQLVQAFRKHGKSSG